MLIYRPMVDIGLDIWDFGTQAFGSGTNIG